MPAEPRRQGNLTERSTLSTPTTMPRVIYSAIAVLLIAPVCVSAVEASSTGPGGFAHIQIQNMTKGAHRRLAAAKRLLRAEQITQANDWWCGHLDKTDSLACRRHKLQQRHSQALGAAEREVVRAELKALLEGAGDQALTTLRADVLSMQRGFCALASSRSLELCANFRSLEQQRRRKKQQQQQKQKQQQKQRSQQKQRGRQQPQPQARRRSNQKVRPWLVVKLMCFLLLLAAFLGWSFRGCYAKSRSRSNSPTHDGPHSITVHAPSAAPPDQFGGGADGSARRRASVALQSKRARVWTGSGARECVVDCTGSAVLQLTGRAR